MYAITGITGKVGGALARTLLATSQPPLRCARHHAGTVMGRLRLGRDSMDSTKAESTAKERKQLCSTVRRIWKRYFERWCWKLADMHRFAYTHHWSVKP